MINFCGGGKISWELPQEIFWGFLEKKRGEFVKIVTNFDEVEAQNKNLCINCENLDEIRNISLFENHLNLRILWGRQKIMSRRKKFPTFKN